MRFFLHQLEGAVRSALASRQHKINYSEIDRMLLPNVLGLVCATGFQYRVSRPPQKAVARG